MLQEECQNTFVFSAGSMIVYLKDFLMVNKYYNGWTWKTLDGWAAWIKSKNNIAGRWCRNHHWADL